MLLHYLVKHARLKRVKSTVTCPLADVPMVRRLFATGSTLDSSSSAVDLLPSDSYSRRCLGMTNVCLVPLLVIWLPDNLFPSSDLLDVPASLLETTK